MRYWVYINDKVDGPHNESELVTLRGFTPDTLICSEESASSGNQQWMKASSVFEFDREPSSPFGGGLDARTKEELFSKLDALMEEFAELRTRLNDMQSRLEQKIDQVPDATIGKTKVETISNAHVLLGGGGADTFAGNDKLDNTGELVAQAEDMVASANEQTQSQEEVLEPAKDDLILNSAMDSMYNAQLAEEAENTFQDLLTPVQAEKLSKEAENVVEEKIPAETTPTEEEAQRDAFIKEITSPDKEDVIDQIIEEKKEEAQEDDGIEDIVISPKIISEEKQEEEVEAQEVQVEEQPAEEQQEEPKEENDSSVAIAAAGVAAVAAGMLAGEEKQEQPAEEEPVIETHEVAEDIPAEKEHGKTVLDLQEDAQPIEEQVTPVEKTEENAEDKPVLDMGAEPAEEQPEEPAQEQAEPAEEKPVLDMGEMVAAEQPEEPAQEQAEPAEEKPVLDMGEMVAAEQPEEQPAQEQAEPTEEQPQEEPAQQPQTVADEMQYQANMQDLPSLDDVSQSQETPVEQEEFVSEEKEESFEELVPEGANPVKQEDGLISDTDIALAATDMSLESAGMEKEPIEEAAPEPAEEAQQEETEGEMPALDSIEGDQTPANQEVPTESFEALFAKEAGEEDEEPVAEEQAQAEQADEVVAPTAPELPEAPQAPVAEQQTSDTTENQAEAQEGDEDSEEVDPSAMTEIQLQEGSTYLISDFVPSADPEQSAADQLVANAAGTEGGASEEDVQDMLASFVQVRQDDEQEEQTEESSADAVLNLEDPLKDRRGASYDIRTVPMVQDPTDTERLNVDALTETDDVNTQHEVKSTQTNQGGSNKVILGTLVALLLVVILYVILGFMHLIPNSLNVFGAKESKQVASAQVMQEMFQEKKPAAKPAPAPAAAPVAAKEAVVPTEGILLAKLKNYLLPNGKTLKEFVEQKHAPISADLITWSVAPAPNGNNEYVANIKVPPANPQSFKITYRFNYNFATNALVPTISDSKKLLEEARNGAAK